MSMIFCENCQNHIDTDHDVEHEAACLARSRVEIKRAIRKVHPELNSTILKLDLEELQALKSALGV